MGYQVNLAIQSYKEVVLMDRDEILERSRRENLGEDEYEREVSLRSAQLGMKVGLLACCVVAALSVALTGRTNAGCWVIYFSIWGASALYRYRLLGQKVDLGYLIGSIAVGLLFAVLYARELMGAG